MTDNLPAKEPRMEDIMALQFEDLTGKIIGAAIEAHKELGPGFLEVVYEKALVLELRQRGIPFQRQLTVPVRYHDVEVGKHRLDLFVADQIVVEVKALQGIKDVHFAVVRSYLRAVERNHGLILNFSKVVLEARRVMVRNYESPFLGSWVP